MAKHPAPVSLTGGAGFNYEDQVAGRFLVDMLGGIASFGSDFGHVARIDWQARDDNRLLDDLVVTLEAADGQHTAECSIKSHRQVTSSGFPENFVEAAWEEWLQTVSAAFNRNRDLLVLATGEIANDVIEAWKALLRESLATTPDRMVNRLREGKDPGDAPQASETERELFASLHCPEALKSSGSSDATNTIEVIRRIRLLHFDFQSEPSRDEARVVADCQKLIRSGDPDEAKKLWETICGIAADNRPAGGSLDLPALLAKLRSLFGLADHPDYCADWSALEESTQDVLENVRTEIGGAVALSREDEISGLASVLTETGICIAVGESGCGKSALAKILGARMYGSTVVLSSDTFAEGGKQHLQRSLGIRHPIADVLSAASDSCLLVLDAMESASERGLQLAGQIVAEILSNSNCRHVHILLVMQFDAARRVGDRLAEAGVKRSKLQIFPIQLPDEDVVRSLAEGIPEVPWATLHRDIRPLLQNLKILDWVVRASRAGGDLNQSNVSGLTSLIDYLWGRWVEDDGGGLARGELLKKLATIEAATLAAGIPLTVLDNAEHRELPPLISTGLLRRRNERLRFSHDLLADWARLKVLIGDDPTTSNDGLQRCTGARWHRAVRLFGRWLLSQPDGVQRWSQALQRCDNESEEGIVVRDLLLDSIVVNQESFGLLTLAWPVLSEQDGLLLKRLLNRFLYVATGPHIRLASLPRYGHSALQIEVAFRVPLASYWGALLKALNDHADEVCRLVPIAAAQICRMWLAESPKTLSDGRSFPWRTTTARVALRIARELQAQLAEGRYFSDHQDRIAYEAALYSAHEMPDAVAEFALEMSQRRHPSQEIQFRADAARRASEEAERQRELEDPERVRRIRKLCTTARPGGRLRDPWPDGPRHRVTEAFREAVLNSLALISLAEVRADVALEILLAVCIEHPKREDPYGGSSATDDCGLRFWRDISPPMYFRGPFLQFLRVCPTQGVEFVVRLINFATARRMAQEERRISRRGNESLFEDDDELFVSVQFGDQAGIWRGDRRVFRWYLDWPVDCKIITCALMAFEKWLYEQIDAGVDIEGWLQQIMDRSESVAFAGLLIDVGKREPRYFLACLRPLLGVSEFYRWEPNILMERSTPHLGLMGWWNQPAELVEVARKWHTAQHRQYGLMWLAARLMFRSPEMEAFFDECTRRWRQELNDKENPRWLLLLIVQLDPTNYRKTPIDGGKLQIEFVPPDGLLEQLQDEQNVTSESMRLITFPMECRKVLDGEKTLPEEEAQTFWDTIIGIANQSVSDEEDEWHRAGAITGGIAVLLKHHRGWLDSDSEKLSWCMRQLQEIFENPPPSRQFDVADSAGDWTWDCFIAEAGVCLLRELPDDPFVRTLVARGIAAYHYGTTQKTMRLAFEFRAALRGEFALMQQLAIWWSAVRPLRERSEHYLSDVRHWQRSDEDPFHEHVMVDELVAEADKWKRAHLHLIDGFGQGMIEPMTLRGANEEANQKAERMISIRFPAQRAGATSSKPTSWHRSRRTIRRKPVQLDGKVVQASLSWVDLSSARSETERQSNLNYVRDLLRLVLDSLQPVNDGNADENDDDELDGHPDKLDGWIFDQVARAISQMRHDEQVSTLWQPILEAGLHAHDWIERFFWSWFSNGFEATQSPQAFVDNWTKMLQFALASPEWEIDAGRNYDLGSMVYELLGFHFGIHSVAADDRFSSILEKAIPIFDAAAQRWFRLPRVANGFARIAIEPAYDRLLCPGILWLRNSVTAADDYEFWRQSQIEPNLISVLSLCWERHHKTVTANSDLQSAFLELLAALVTRGNHAAMALRDRLLDSIPQME